MSAGGGKRISVFDRLGPGADEGVSHHRSYGSDKHPAGGNYGNSSSGPDKGRYSSSGSTQHKDEGVRERKPRHRSSGDTSVEIDGVEDKRTSVKGSRDITEVKQGSSNTSGSGTKSSRGNPPSGDSDYEEGLEEAKRKKVHRGSNLEDRNKHGPLEEEGHGVGRRSARDRKDKVGGVGASRLDRPGNLEAATIKSPDKLHSRREMGGANSQSQVDLKRRKEDEYKMELVTGQKRKRDIQDDLTYAMDVKKSRRKELGRDSDGRHNASAGLSDGGERYHYGGLATSKEGDYFHSNSSSSSRSRRLEPSSVGGDSFRKRTRLSQTPEPPESGGSGKMGRSHHRTDKEDVRRSGVDGTGEHRTEGAPPPPKARSLDWTAVDSFSNKANSKLQHIFSSVLDKFQPGVLLKDLKVSTSLAGPRFSQLVQEAILRDVGVAGNDAGQLTKKAAESCEEELPTCEETEDSEGKTATEGKVDSELVTQSSHVTEGTSKATAEMREGRGSLTWDTLTGECLLPCRRALTAADDYAIRRRLKKDHQGYLTTARSTPDRWTRDQYASSVQLFNFVPAKPSGKPATKLLSSRVGSVVISR